MDKFTLFLFKILKEYKFSWLFKLSFLVVIPIALIYTYLNISHVQEVKNIEFDPLDEASIYFVGGEEDKLFFYPETDETVAIIENLRERLEIVASRVQGFRSVSDLDNAISSNGNKNLFAILFHNASASALEYTIRNRNTPNLATDRIFRNNYNELNYRQDDDYIKSGLIKLQVAINELFLRHRNVTPFPVTFEHFPSDEFQVTTNIDIVYFACLLMVFCCLNVVNTVLIPMVDEKESGVRSLLKIATRLFYLNEVARLLVNLCFFVLFISIIFIMVQAYQLWGSVTFVFPYLLTILFILSLISHTIALSLLFKRVEYCKIAGILFYFIPFCVLRALGDDWWLKKFQYISPLNLFVNGMEIVKEHVLTDRDINLSMVNEVPKEAMGTIPKPHLFVVYGILFINAVGYFIGYLLLKNVDSRDSLHRTVDKLIRRCGSSSKVNSMQEGMSMMPPENAIVHVQQAVKQFHSCSTVKKAVNGVDMDVLNNEITVLLGHNGAGKTTLISMITGILRPDSGRIWVNGLTDSRQYEQFIGYCPQQNVFIRQFNCHEHVTFFGRLRGIPAHKIQEEADKVLNQVKLLPYASQYPCELSGGMKRRLCLAISIIGDTRVVVLDEPTSGLDPRSRRDLWDILLQLKHERAILLTTHYMEEADILGDTIAIMESGTIVCRDTPLELKKKYTSGYILKIVTDPNFDENETTLLLNEEAPRNTIKSTIHPTRSFNIPHELKPKYSTILRRLESNKQSLKINSVSITNPPLEEVFLRCSSMPDGDECDVVDAPSSYSVIQAIRDNDGDAPHVGGCSLFCHQVLGMVYKKLIHLKREWLYFLFLALIPFACLYLSQLLIHLSLSGVEQNRLKLAFDQPSPGDTIIVVMSGLNYIEQNRLKDALRAQAPGIQFDFPNHQDLNEELRARQRQDAHYYNEKLLAGIDFNFAERTVKIYFSGNYYHGTPKSYNLVTNVLLAVSGPDAMRPAAHVETWTRPMLKRTEEIGRSHVYIYENLVPMGWFLYILFYATDPFNDISTQFKSLFCLSARVYWVISWLFDLSVHAVIVVILTSVSCYGSFIELFDAETYVNLGIIYFVYAIPTIALLYVLSRYIRTQENLYAIMFYLAVTGVVLSQLLSMSYEKVQEYMIMSRFLFLIPDFGVRHAMSLTIFDYFTQLKADGVRDSSVDFSLSWYFAISCILGIGLLLVLINISDDLYFGGWLRKAHCGRRRDKPLAQSPSNDLFDAVDSKVRTEKEETQKLWRQNSETSGRLEYPVIVVNLMKAYDEKYAVRDLCFRVKKGECFGLLGTNGAGKTSTLEMMTLNRSLTDGTILLNNIHCRREEDKYRRTFGYCPQIDALNPSMTAYETIKYMALIKGVTNVERETAEWLSKCDLEAYKDVPVGNYSGGTKRKLNTAIAMIGSPPVIFLDEPTTGIDPVSRRKIWLCIKELVRAGKTIILTSHSLDECEALCNRIGIMYHGQLQCIGVTQELKNSLGDGYTLIIKLTESMGSEEVARLREQLRRSHYDPSGSGGAAEKEVLRARLSQLTEEVVGRLEESMRSMGMEWSTKDHHGSILKYRVDRRDIVWSEVFDTLMNLKEANGQVISDYSVNEVSLEDIFLQIGRQREGTPPTGSNV